MRPANRLKRGKKEMGLRGQGRGGGERCPGGVGVVGVGHFCWLE